MAAAVATIAVTHGDTRPKIFDRYSPPVGMPLTEVMQLTALPEGATAEDLSDMYCQLALYARGTDTEVCTLTSESGGGITLGGSSGRITIDLGHADYVALDPGVYSLRWDFVEDGETRPFLRGEWRITK